MVVFSSASILLNHFITITHDLVYATEEYELRNR